MNTAFESELKKRMSVDGSGIGQPDPLLVFEARHVLSQKAGRRAGSIVRKVMHSSQIAFCTLLLTAGAICWPGVRSGYSGGAADAQHSTVLCFSQSTLCVISNTMLTSTPTLRN